MFYDPAVRFGAVGLAETNVRRGKAAGLFVIDLRLFAIRYSGMTWRDLSPLKR